MKRVVITFEYVDPLTGTRESVEHTCGGDPTLGPDILQVRDTEKRRFWYPLCQIHSIEITEAG